MLPLPGKPALDDYRAGKTADTLNWDQERGARQSCWRYEMIRCAVARGHDRAFARLGVPKCVAQAASYGRAYCSAVTLVDARASASPEALIVWKRFSVKNIMSTTSGISSQGQIAGRRSLASCEVDIIVSEECATTASKPTLDPSRRQ
jgi:hypothetical protein